MNDFFANIITATLPYLNFFFSDILPVLCFVLVVFCGGIAIGKFFELFISVSFLQTDVKSMRKELDKARDEIRELKYKSLR